MEYRVKSEILGVSAHSIHFVQYKKKWWHRWRNFERKFRWPSDAKDFIKELEGGNSK